MIKLGNKIKSKVTGFEGVSTSKSTSLSGSVQFNIRPNGLTKDLDPITGQWYDVQELEKIDDGISGDYDLKPVTTDISLGDTVVHMNGFEGVAMEFVEYLNGCVYFGVMPKVGKDNKMPDLEYIPVQYLTVKEGKKKETSTSPTGGPATGAPMM